MALERLLQFVVELTKNIPVLICTAGVAYSYWAMMLEFSRVQFPSEHKLVRVSSIAFYHVIFVMYVWSFVQLFVTTSRSADIPDQFRITPKTRQALADVEDNADKVEIILRALALRLGIQTYLVDGRVRYCDVCELIKPDRTHHCRVCNACIMKMDHHCPWINNCVCYSNYKFFILFLTYGLIYFGFILLSVSFNIFKQRENVSWIKVTLSEDSPLLLMAMMMTCLKLALLSYHIYLLLRNRTTLEAYRAPQFIYGPDSNGFDLGPTNNFYQVFGLDWTLWGLPVFTSLGNGWSFPTRSDMVFIEASLSGGDKWDKVDEKERLISR